jgi:hypothetical protein
LKDLIPDAILVLGLLVSILGLIDYFVSDAAKSKMALLTIRVWSKLDDQKQRPLVDRIRKHKTLWTLTAPILSLLLVVVSLALDPVIRTYHWPTPEGGVWTFSEVAVLSLVVIIPVGYLLAIYGISHLIIELVEHATSKEVMGYTLIGVAVASFLLEYGEVFTQTFPMLGVLFWFIGVLIGMPVFVGALVLFPVYCAYLASAILAGGEWIVRRVAESPRGLIVALGVALSAFAALLKIFQ